MNWAVTINYDKGFDIECLTVGSLKDATARYRSQLAKEKTISTAEVIEVSDSEFHVKNKVGFGYTVAIFEYKDNLHLNIRGTNHHPSTLRERTS